MANLNKLPELIKKTGLEVLQFGLKIYPKMKSETAQDRSNVNKQIKQCISAKSVKFDLLDNIAEVTGEDYNSILDYDNRK